MKIKKMFNIEMKYIGGFDRTNYKLQRVYQQSLGNKIRIMGRKEMETNKVKHKPSKDESLGLLVGNKIHRNQRYDG